MPSLQPIIEDATNYYHSLLNGSLAADAQAKLAEGTARHRLSFGKRPICNVLRPLFVTAWQYEYMRRESSLVLSAIQKLYAALVRDARLRAELD